MWFFFDSDSDSDTDPEKKRTYFGAHPCPKKGASSLEFRGHVRRSEGRSESRGSQIGVRRLFHHFRELSGGSFMGRNMVK